MKNKFIFLCLFFFGGIISRASAQHVQQINTGIIIQSSANEKLKLNVISSTVVHVEATLANDFSNKKSLIVTEKKDAFKNWKVVENAAQVQVTTDSLKIVIDKNNLQTSFYNKQQQLILSEDVKSIEAAKDGNENCFHIKQNFRYSPNEKLYGLGSFQNTDVALNGKKISLLQQNRDDVVPVIVSTNHYGLLWDNYSFSEFNDTKDGYYLWSEVADEINYYFIYGASTDNIVASVRTLTGHVPMFPKWVFGYIQSKQKYNTQEEIVNIVKQFRERKFPLDVIVQDWLYWPQNQWGQKSFDHHNYPDPSKMVNDIHNMNAKIIISIWPNMAKGSPNQIEMKKVNGLFYDDEHLNILNDAARKLYWQQVKDSLFSTGIDGWWADCSEGFDSDWTYGDPTFKLSHSKQIESNLNVLKKMMGTGRYANIYALMHTKGLYEGQRNTTSDKRVYILTRSAFAGMQKYAASYWTGDVSANWEEFRMQIPAGINFCMTGIPYWTTDIAGYFAKRQNGWWFANGAFDNGQQDEGYKELYTRWFQFASFCPLFRAHGADFPREPWAFGSPESRTYQTLLKFTNLRYRLLPYIYSLAWKVTNENYTIMRGLPFDFANDSLTYNINDQYMFGNSFLVSPVTKPMFYLPGNIKLDSQKNYSREVYLPKSSQWYDFWTGEKFAGGQTIQANAAFETMPLFVKAGSVVPLGPFIQYSSEKTDPVELRIYQGNDGEFVLYEDEGDNYNYEKGMYSTIKFLWNEKQKTFIIGERNGDFNGMLKNRKFNIVLVNKNKGTGAEVSANIDKEIIYNGKETVIQF